MSTTGPITTRYIEAGGGTVQHSATQGKELVNYETMAKGYTGAVEEWYVNTFPTVVSASGSATDFYIFPADPTVPGVMEIEFNATAAAPPVLVFLLDNGGSVTYPVDAFVDVRVTAGKTQTIFINPLYVNRSAAGSYVDLWTGESVSAPEGSLPAIRLLAMPYGASVSGITAAYRVNNILDVADIAQTWFNSIRIRFRI